MRRLALQLIEWFVPARASASEPRRPSVPTKCDKSLGRNCTEGKMLVSRRAMGLWGTMRGPLMFGVIKSV